MNAAGSAIPGDTAAAVHRRWCPAALFWLAVSAVVVLTWPTWVGLVRVWNNQFGYSHGFLVAPIAAWLAWRALAQKRDHPPVPSWAMLAAVAVTSFAWLFLRLASIRTLEEVAAVALVWSATTAVLGWRWGRALLFPIGYLLFAIPIWEALVPVLQPLTTEVAGGLCDLIGIPTHLDGNIVHIPNGVFAISEGCAGSHYFVASVTLAALYSYLEYSRWRSSLILISLAAALAIVCNWLRVVVVIYAGYATGMQHPWVDDHNMVGWALFAVAVIPLSLAARRLERGAEAAVLEPATIPQSQWSRLSTVLAALLAVLAAMAWPQGLVWLHSRQNHALTPATTEMPVVDGWEGPLAADVDWTPAFPSADAQLRAAYEDEGVRITLFKALYEVQEDAKEVIGYENRIEGKDGWALTDDSAVEIPQLGRWRRSLLSSGDGRRRIVVYRYTIAGRSTASRFEAKMRQGLGGLTGDRSASIVAASTVCPRACVAVEQDLLRFLGSWLRVTKAPDH